MKNCSICHRPLDHEAASASDNCGGDCLSCTIDCEDDDPAPKHLPVEELRAWITACDLRQIAMRDAATEDVAADAHALIRQVAMARLLAWGHTEETAQAVVEHVLAQPSPYPIPTIAELGSIGSCCRSI